MPQDILTMTATLFTMRLPGVSGRFSEVTITGSGFVYDSATGAMLDGMVQTITITQYVQAPTRLITLQSEKLGNIHQDAEVLAATLGSTTWNHAGAMVESLPKISGLFSGIQYSLFSPQKSFVIGSADSDLLYGSKLNDSLIGGGGDDELWASNGNDTLLGLGGDDLLNGENGNDLLIDFTGNNTFYGGKGNDTLAAGSGVDALFGGLGDDWIVSGGGVDTAYGGGGHDHFVFAAKSSASLTIRDFGADDILVDQSAASAKAAYDNFVGHARQDGRNVVYDAGELHLVLRNFRLAALDIDNFGDSAMAATVDL